MQPLAIGMIAGISGGLIVVLGLGFFSVEIPTIQDVHMEIDPKEKCKTLSEEYYGILNQYPNAGRVDDYPPNEQKRIMELMPLIADYCNRDRGIIEEFEKQIGKATGEYAKYYDKGYSYLYVTSSDMRPAMSVYDVLLIDETPFEEIQVGDIIAFDRPVGHNRMVVSRVAEITDENPLTIRTKADNNPTSIPNTDFPITDKDYFGKVVEVLKPKKYPQKLGEEHWFKDQETWIPNLIEKVY